MVSLRKKIRKRLPFLWFFFLVFWRKIIIKDIKFCPTVNEVNFLVDPLYVMFLIKNFIFNRNPSSYHYGIFRFFGSAERMMKTFFSLFLWQVNEKMVLVHIKNGSTFFFYFFKKYFSKSIIQYKRFEKNIYQMIRGLINNFTFFY